MDLPALPSVLERPAISLSLPPVKVPWAASRYGLVMGFALVHLAVAGMTRIALALKALAAGRVPANALPAVFAIGTGYDLVTSLYLCLPFTAYLLLLPENWYRSRLHRATLRAGMYLAIFGICYLAAVEFFFFDEFNARFNYVAVEYLIYPHEVFVNIWQSYPVARAMIAAAGIAVALTWWLRLRIAAALQAASSPRSRLAPAAVLLALAAASYPCVDGTSGRVTHNRVADELAANGIYSFFSAAANAHLDYTQYYATVGDAEAAARVRQTLAASDADGGRDAASVFQLAYALYASRGYRLE